MKIQVYEMENLIQKIKQQTELQDHEENKIFNHVKSDGGEDYQPMETGRFSQGKKGVIS